MIEKTAETFASDHEGLVQQRARCMSAGAGRNITMPYYRHVAYSSDSKAKDLGSMVPRRRRTRALGNRVIRDLIGTRAEHYYGWTLDIAEGERALPSMPAN